MKTKSRFPSPRVLIAAGVSLWTAALCSAQVQSIPLDGFESPAYTAGPLNGQNGWAAVSVNQSSTVNVTAADAFSGGQSLYLHDGDTTNRPKARYDYGSNFTNGQFAIAVKEDPASSGRDLWRIDFFNTGAGSANFSLVLANSTTLTLSCGASVSVNLSSTTYDPAGWNTFNFVFDDSAKTMAVYLNGSSTPVLSSANTSTSWVAGRVELSVGNASGTGQGVYYDNAFAEWQVTNKMRYAPPTLVAPVTHTVTSVNYTLLTLPTDQDTIVNLATTGPIRKNVQLKGGRNVRILGGYFGAGTLLTGGSGGPSASLYVEGVKFDKTVGLPDGSSLSTLNGVYVDPNFAASTDAFHIGGVAPGSATAPDVYIQNCLVTGIHCTNSLHDYGILAQVLSADYNGYAAWQSSSWTYQFVLVVQGTALATQLASTSANQYDGTFILGATTSPYLNHGFTRYAGTLSVNVAGTPVTTTDGLATYNGNTVIACCYSSPWYDTIPAVGALSLGSGSAGYLWPGKSAAGATGHTTNVHADAYQADESTLTGHVYLYDVTVGTANSAFIGGDLGSPDKGLRALSLTRVNVTQQNTVWPQDDNADALDLKNTVVPATLHDVWVQPRPAPVTLTAALLAWPGGSETHPTFNAGNTSASWLTIPQITDEPTGGPGLVYLSTDGHGRDGADYALSGANAPGLNYVSPGYSSDALKPLVLDAILTAPLAGTLSGSTLTVPSASVAAANSPVAREDVSFQHAGYIIDLSLTANGGGRFKIDPAIDPRDIVTTDAVPPGTYTVTVKASEDGNSANAITKTLSIIVQ